MSAVDAPDGAAQQDIPRRPEWLNDEPGVITLLGAFLDRLDRRPVSERTRIPSIAITRKTLPALHRNDEAAARTWALLRTLEGQVFEIRPNRKRQPYDPEYLGASLRFLEASEAICRAWLDRPWQPRYHAAWAAAVDAHADAFADRGAALAARPARVAGKNPSEVVAAFAQIGALSSAALTVRQLSARVFWGHSKILDTREDVLERLFPRLVLAPRPILVQVCLPRSCQGVVFIENLDTYVQALAGRPADAVGLGLVYSAGFRGSAERIRRCDGVSLHYHGNSDGQVQARFEAWWFDQHRADWPVWFWGDLDFSGMAILKALRQRFGDVQAWQPGYVPMMQLLREGGGHSPDTADKVEQPDPGATGCRYADQQLLPALRECARFIDQEAV